MAVSKPLLGPRTLPPKPLDLRPPCYHKNTEPVHLSTGELVSVLCLDCDDALPAGFMGRYNHTEEFYRNR